MKKLFAIFVLALFIVSMVPLALAEDENNETDNSQIVYSENNEISTANNETEKTETSTNDVNKEDLKRTLQDRKEQAKEKLKQLNEAKKEFTKEVKDAKKDLKDQVKEQREQLRQKVKECKAQNDSSQCKTVKDELKKDVKSRLVLTADEMLVLLNSLKDKVNALNPADKTDILAGLDAEIAKVNDIKTKIEALPADAKPQDVKDLAKQLQDVWNESKKVVRFHATRMMAVGFENVLIKAEKLEAKLDSTLAQLKAKGLDVSVADAQVAEFKTHVAEARTAYDEANTLLQGYRADPSKDGAVQAIQEKMNVAKKALQEAQKSLREAVKAIKEQKDGEKILNEEVAKKDSEDKQESEDKAAPQNETQAQATA